jgi:hypothetical protein
VCNEIIRDFCFGFRVVYTKGRLFHGLISFHNRLSFPLVNVTFGILEASLSVTAAYQESARLNILIVENWIYFQD